jgi:hypothetical protein
MASSWAAEAAVGAVVVELAADHRAPDRPEWAVDGLIHGAHRHLLEGDRGEVLGPVHLAGVWRGGHDHRRRAVRAREPGTQVAVDQPRLVVVEHRLAEVPDRPVIRLRVVVECGLLDAAVEKGEVLGDQRPDPHAPHSNARVSGREGGLGVERLAFDLGAEDGRVKVADREQRVCDRGRIRERGQGEVEALAPRRNRKLLQAGCGELGRVGCGIGVEPPAGSVSLAELPSPPQPPTARAASRVAPTAAAAGRIPVLCGCRVIGGSLVWGIC